MQSLSIQSRIRRAATEGGEAAQGECDQRSPEHIPGRRCKLVMPPGTESGRDDKFSPG